MAPWAVIEFDGFAYPGETISLIHISSSPSGGERLAKRFTQDRYRGSYLKECGKLIETSQKAVEKQRKKPMGVK